MKWLASFLLLIIVALAIFVTPSTVKAVHISTPSPNPTQPPVISAGTTPTPTPQ